MGTKTTHKFKAEISQLLDILVHSLYTNKEIFLRELISNASDALEKVRFRTQAEGKADELAPEIRISCDADAKTLTVSDTGIGMTRDELMQNIGTIAHSGTAELARLAEEGKESLDSLIGRFGVGFYSVYMVADEVTVITKAFAPEAKVVSWTSDGRTDYKLQDLDEDRPHGTEITLRLKDDEASRFTNEAHLKQIVKKHSNFINFPIYVGDERVNTIQALWREPKFQIKPEQYAEFYKFLTFDSEDPFDTLHTSVDAPVQFNALMFIPKDGGDPFGLGRENRGLDLYVRRVLIEKQNKDLLPEYLGFVKGVVDTEDLPLNISRETLQDNLLMRKISSTLVKQVLDHLTKMAKDDADRYAEFWRAHGELFKAGYMDFLNKDKFAGLVRFNSSALDDDDKALTSLADYISRAKEEQKEIYYAYGPSRQALSLSPHLEVFRRKHLEVMYLYEPIDEFVMDALREYEGYSLVSAEHADMAKLDKFESVEKEDKPEPLSDEQKSELDKLLARMKDALGDAVTEVKASTRLSESPVCLANPDGNVTSSMDKIMRVMSKDTSIPKKILEVNPDHPLVRNMLAIMERDENDPFIEQAANQLFESALLLEGYLTDPHALVGRVQDLLTKSSGWYVATGK